jgi:hypothetical protein
VLHEAVISLEIQLLTLLRQEAHGPVGSSAQAQFKQALSRAPNNVNSPPELDTRRAICSRTTNCGGNAIVTIVFLRLDGIEKLLNVNACFALSVPGERKNLLKPRTEMSIGEGAQMQAESKQSEPASAEDSRVHDRDGWRFSSCLAFSDTVWPG